MQRLKELRKERKLSLKELGDLLDVAESTVSLYENLKREAPYSILIKTAKIFNVSIDYLIGEANEKSTNSIAVPILDSISLCSGEADFLYSDSEENIELGEADSHFFFKAHDDLMEPYISAGDIALIKKQNDVESGELAAVVYENSPVTLKKVVKEGNITVLVPLNQKYQNIFIKDNDKLIILGKVIETIRKW